MQEGSQAAGYCRTCLVHNLGGYGRERAKYQEPNYAYYRIALHHIGEILGDLRALGLGWLIVGSRKRDLI